LGQLDGDGGIQTAVGDRLRRFLVLGHGMARAGQILDPLTEKIEDASDATGVEFRGRLERLIEPLPGDETVCGPAGDRILGDLLLELRVRGSPHQRSVDHHASRSGLTGVQMATATVGETLLKRDLAHIRSRPRRRESHSTVEALSECS
jgi:hypothetical protein